MGRINEVTRFVVLQINVLAGLVGVALFCMAIYVLAANWGDLDQSRIKRSIKLCTLIWESDLICIVVWTTGFFFESGIVALLFGFILTLVAVLGCLGVMYQIKRTGSRISQ
jgi:uncharacterized membrane protein